MKEFVETTLKEFEQKFLNKFLEEFSKEKSLKLFLKEFQEKSHKKIMKQFVEESLVFREIRGEVPGCSNPVLNTLRNSSSNPRRYLSMISRKIRLGYMGPYPGEISVAIQREKLSRFSEKSLHQFLEELKKK